MTVSAIVFMVAVWAGILIVAFLSLRKIVSAQSSTDDDTKEKDEWQTKN